MPLVRGGILERVQHAASPVELEATLVANLRGVPVFKQMFLRRLRTLMEELLQAPGTPANLLKYEREVDQLVGPIAPDADLTIVCFKGGKVKANHAVAKGQLSDDKIDAIVESACAMLE